MTNLEMTNKIFYSLEKAINEFEKEEATRIDNTIKNDSMALKAFSRAEERSLKRRETISDFKALIDEFINKK